MLDSEIDVLDICFLLQGEGSIDLADWKANTRVSGVRGSEVEQWFWLVVQDFDENQRRDLLQFVCALRTTPVGGFAALEFKFELVIRDTMPSNSYPVAHTCFNQLELPAGYRNRRQLQQKLLVSMQHAEMGMG
jgi:hypothetical protein